MMILFVSYVYYFVLEFVVCGFGCVLLFWFMMLVIEVFCQGQEVVDKYLCFLEEEIKLYFLYYLQMVIVNQVCLMLCMLSLCEYGKFVVVYVVLMLVVVFYVGYILVIVDYYYGQSLVEMLMEYGVLYVFLIDWYSVSEDMKDLEIDNYLVDFCVVIDEFGGCVNLVGLCQGGWILVMIVVCFLYKVQWLVLVGLFIDVGVGVGLFKQMVECMLICFYEDLVCIGGGFMCGSFMLQGWKNMYFDEYYFSEYVDLFQYIDDLVYLVKCEIFVVWYEMLIDLLGCWYFQVICQIFKDNLLVCGQYVVLGKMLDLCDIICLFYLLVGECDDIIIFEQVFNVV